MRRITIRAKVESEMSYGPDTYRATVTLAESKDGTLRVESIDPLPEDEARLTDAWMNS